MLRSTGRASGIAASQRQGDLMADSGLNDRRVVLLVTSLLGAIAIIGLVGVIWLVWRDTDPASIAIVSSLAATALGSLGALLVSAKTSAAPTDTPGPSDPVASVASASIPTDAYSATPPPWTGQP